MIGLIFGGVLTIAFLATIIVECRPRKRSPKIDIDENGNVMF